MKFPSPMLLIPFLALLGCDNAVQENDSTQAVTSGAVAFSVVSMMSESGDSLDIVISNGTQSKKWRLGAGSNDWQESLPAGTWNLEVVQSHGDVELRRSAAAVEVFPGSLSAVRYSLTTRGLFLSVRLQVDAQAGKIGGDTVALRQAIQGNWHMESLPAEGVDTLTKDVLLSLQSSGSVMGSDGCGDFTGSWSVLSDSLLMFHADLREPEACAAVNGAAYVLQQGVFQFLKQRHCRWQIRQTHGYKQLVLRNGYDGSILATFADRWNVIAEAIQPAYPQVLRREWHLESLPAEGLASISKNVILSLDSTGAVSGSDGCRTLWGSWSARPDSVLNLSTGFLRSVACTEDSKGTLLDRGWFGTWRWQVQDLGARKRLILRSEITGALLATFVDSLASAVPGDLQPIPEGLRASDAKELIGSWHLSRFPLEGIDSVTIDVPLVLDSTGRLKGTDGCHAFQGTWSVPSDSLLRLRIVQDTLACADTGSTLKISLGMHLLGAGDLRWEFLPVDSLGVKTLVLRSDMTGKEFAVYKSGPAAP